MLEISGRQTGKTQRMIEHILLHNRGNTVKVKTTSQDQFDRVLYRFLAKKDQHGSFYTGTEILPAKGDFADYYDEFDFLKFSDLDDVNYEGYFCTTPKFIRKDLTDYSDVLCRVLKEKDWRYSTFRHTPSEISYSKHNVGENEIRGKFVKCDVENDFCHEEIDFPDLEYFRKKYEMSGCERSRKQYDLFRDQLKIKPSVVDFLNSLTDEKIKILNDLIQSHTHESYQERLR